ncbi:MAG: carboxylating nicotinate-nucleotide diphosphorylase [Anaerolineae bacterium]|nr:carboxylating nicotinate-nucleotide diphosphorylase [Anaerolineae bacterium]
MSTQHRSALEHAVRLALAEDIGPGDYTSIWTLPASSRSRAVFVAKEEGVVAGLEAAEMVFALTDPDCRCAFWVNDGNRVSAGQEFGEVDGPTRAVLAAERTALNFLQRASGIATATRAYVDAVRGTGAVILDTRKTAPGLRHLDKAAVVAGGGRNHRFGLFDMVLIKDNHIAAAGGVTAAVQAVNEHNTLGLPVEVEVTTLEQLQEALSLGVDRILLDNMPVPIMEQAVRLAGGRVPLEASGGVTLESVAAIAATGVDFISVGALTHSVKALDISLDIVESSPSPS